MYIHISNRKLHKMGKVELNTYTHISNRKLHKMGKVELNATVIENVVTVDSGCLKHHKNRLPQIWKGAMCQQ